MHHVDPVSAAERQRRRYDRPVVVLLPMTLCPVCMGSGFEESDVRCRNCFYPTHPGYIPLQLGEEQERVIKAVANYGPAKKGVSDRSGDGSATLPARSRAS